MRRILLATHASYLDSANGASVACRCLLEALVRRGFAASALTGSVMELSSEITPESWMKALGIEYEKRGDPSRVVDARGVRSVEPTHYRLRARGVDVDLHRSPSSRPHVPDRSETSEFLRLVEQTLERFRPDVLINYGGDELAATIRERARSRGIAVVFALHNFHYDRKEPFETADVVVVPSHFAARHYRSTLGLDCAVLPNIVDPDRVVAPARNPRYLTFVNPSAEKGVFVFARIADELGRLRPDIPILVVESRGTEATVAACGLDLRPHRNVFFMGHTSDPRRFWGVTRACLMPSLWRENQPLTAIEAMLNGIPVVASDRGGLPEALGEAGIVLPLPDRLTPATRMLPTPEEVSPWVEAISKLWDNPLHAEERSRAGLAEAGRWKTEEIVSGYEGLLRDLGHGCGSDWTE